MVQVYVLLYLLNSICKPVYSKSDLLFFKNYTELNGF